jgi:Na+/H+ antiporter NhaC
MAKHEQNANKGDLFTTADRPYGDIDSAEGTKGKGTIIDLVFPVIILIIGCVIGMTYTGGLFEGESIVDAFANSDASVGLVIGSLCAFVVIVIFYLIRRVMSLKDSMECIPEGLKAMAPAILILTFAWTLKNMTDSLGSTEFVEGVMSSSAAGLANFLPGIIFLVACVIAFSTGTSWGTFGILIPIVVSVFEASSDSTLLIIGMSACMAGAVCGDHCSPISDTTIMASAGAQSNHINHVNTQLPYAVLIAGISFVMYILAPFLKNPAILLVIGVAITVGVLLLIKKAKLGGVFVEKSE